MVTWTDDANLERICAGINAISKYKMRDYHIFGMQQEDRPHVRVSPGCPPSLKELFIKSGYSLEIRDTACDCGREGCSLCNPGTTAIGLRRDVRRNILVARKLIKTIIFSIEGKLILESDSILDLGRKVIKPKETV